MEGGADAGSLTGGSLLMDISLPSMMTELAGEWTLVLAPLLMQVRAGSPVEMGLGPMSTVIGVRTGVISCG